MSSTASSTWVAITPRREAEYEPTRTQRLIWASQRRHEGLPVANMGERMRIRGTLDPARFVAAFDAVVQRVDVLRAVVEPDGETIGVLAAPPASTVVMDLPVTQIEQWSADRIARPIDATTCVYDSVLLRHADDDWTWWIDVHHVAIDAWGAARLAEAVSTAYLHDGPPSAADLGDVVSGSFFGSLDEVADGVDERASEWAEEARAAGPQSPLTLYGPRGERTTRVDRCPLPRDGWQDSLGGALEDSYRSLSPELSLLALSAMATAIAVRRFDGRSSLVVGVPVHHRSGRWGSTAIGPMMELYPMVVTFDDAETHREMFVRTVRSVMQVLRRARPGESPDTPFEVVLNVTTARWDTFAGHPAVRAWMRSGHVEPNHPIRVQVFDEFDPAVDGGHVLRWELDLNRALSVDGSHRALPRHFAAILQRILDDPDAPAGRVAVVDADDRRALATLNPEPAQRPIDRPVHELVRDRLRAAPDAVVVEQDGVTVAAAEFDRRADALARRLVAGGLRPGDPVGLRMGRSIEVLIAVHGVLRAGGRFVFLDPADPAARHETIAADADLFAILDHLPADEGIAAESAPSITLPVVDLDDGAYILYTSGSTGLPKGVPISHRGLADYLDFAVDSYCDPANPPWVALHSALVFDLSITSVFLAMLTGGRTVVFDADPVEALGQIARDHRITFLKGTPSQLEILTRVADGPLSIDTFVVGGEAFRRPVAERVRARCRGPVRIFNEYGPTEAVVGCMIHEYEPERDDGTDVPIGHAAPGSRLAVLDTLGEIAPTGVWGELFVSRPGMASGYLNRPELTAERFGPPPVGTDDRLVLGDDRADLAATVWYRTGDRVRVERPGVLVYGGREDDQLKVNGIRLEPAEVEAALVAHPAIDNALVRVWQPTDAAERRDVHRCSRCGLGVDVPGVEIDGLGVCSVCRQFDEVEPQTRDWFRTPTDLDERLEAARARRRGGYDCLHLLSGGKDSTYALYQLVERGWKVHALTLDNGFISEGAKENVRRSIDDLGITHEFATVDAMNEIFADSLDRYSNVCQGCYKTIYTLAVARAEELGIPVIVTGLSRGQFFETRLVPHQFEAGRFDPADIDATVLEARRVYHATDDAVTQLLPEQRVFDDPGVLDRLEFVDFYRYVDVPLAELYDFLENRAPWVRPADTGRSTNCLVNVAGIRVHQQERGYHNYAEPYSWDVRLGHKTRDEALEELDDLIDEHEVADILGEIGYEPKTQGVLTAWYRSVDGIDLDPDELRRSLRDRLPSHAIPSAFVRLDEVPLAASAKADPALLPAPTRFHRRSGEGVRPETPTQERLVAIWGDILALDSVGITDDFFDLGGASLDALAVVARIDAEFGTDLPDATVFRARTIVELAGLVDNADVAEGDIGVELGDGPLPLSPGEEYMLFEYRSDPTDTRYNVTRLYTLDGGDEPVDVDRLVEAIRDVVMHHEPLHTCFDVSRTRLSRADSLRVIDVGRLSDDELDEWAATIQQEPFDLDAGPLVRAHVGDLGDGRVALFLGMHHIVLGAGTFDTFWKQVTGRVAGDQLPALPTTYARHMLEQRRRHESDETSARFWAETLATSDAAPLRVGVDEAVPDGYLVSSSTLSVAEMTAVGRTAFSTALASAGVVVSAFAGSEQIQIGITASSNDRPDTQDVIGYYLNPLTLSLSVSADDTFAELVGQAAATVEQALPHRTYPFAWVVRDARDAGHRMPDVSVMLAYERIEAPTYPGATARQRILASGSSVADATFFVQEWGDEIRLALEYRGSVMKESAAQRLLDSFRDVLERGVREPTAMVAVLSDPHRAGDLEGSVLPVADLVLRRVLEHVEATPTATAVADAFGQSIDYAAFARAVDATAGAVEVAMTGERAARIGVAVARSLDLVVALYAAQAAGGAAVPLDLTLPDARLRAIARAADLDLIITDDPARCSPLATRSVAVAGPEDGALESLHDRVRRIDPDDISYVIFTSGSTGVPRGVAVSHANLASSIAARDEWFVDGPRRFLVTSSPGFDSSVVGLYWPLATGGTVVVPGDDDVRDIDRLAAAVTSLDVSHTLMVPSLVNALLARAPEALQGLSVSIVAGEACPPALVERHHVLAPDVTMVNEYGPTEATVWSTAHRLRPGDDPVPIGTPIPGATARIVGGDRQRVPSEVAGELWIAGPGVTGGYLDDRAATEERFVSEDGRRWYRTGDLVRSVDGVIRFLGRIDDQLNVGGVRVEPAEIERELESIDGVNASVVVASGDPAVLIAHVVADELDEVEVRAHLRDTLPVGAVPRRFVRQSALPLTANGKVDRAAAAQLAVPVTSLDRSDAPPPASRLAHDVYSAWRMTFSREHIGPDTDFFALGGDSLLAVALITILEGRLAKSVPISVLVSAPTPAGMIEVLASADDAAPPPAERINTVRLREGAPGGPLVVLPTGWSEVFGYQGLADAMPGDIEVLVLGYEWLLDDDLIMTVNALADAMYTAFDWSQVGDRPLQLVGWSFAGSVASEIARLAKRDGQRVDEVVLLDTFFPGMEMVSNANTLRNKWWSYKSLLRPGGGEELRQERERWKRLRSSKAYVSPRQKVKRGIIKVIGAGVTEVILKRTRRLRGIPVPSDDAPAAVLDDGRVAEPSRVEPVFEQLETSRRVVVEIPWTAKQHEPIRSGVPTTYFRASGSDPRFTTRAWREVEPDLDEVVFKGRHKGFNGFLRKDKVGLVAAELARRARGLS